MALWSAGTVTPIFLAPHQVAPNEALAQGLYFSKTNSFSTFSAPSEIPMKKILALGNKDLKKYCTSIV